MLRLKVISFAFLLALFMTGCGALATKGLTDAEKAAMTPAQKFYQVEVERKAYLGLVEKYVSQPFCSPTVIVACANPQAVITLNSIVSRADGYFTLTQQAIESGDGDLVLIYSDLTRSVLRELSTELLKQGLLSASQ